MLDPLCIPLLDSILDLIFGSRPSLSSTHFLTSSNVGFPSRFSSSSSSLSVMPGIVRNFSNISGLFCCLWIHFAYRFSIGSSDLLFGSRPSWSFTHFLTSSNVITGIPRFPSSSSSLSVMPGIVRNSSHISGLFCCLWIHVVYRFSIRSFDPIFGSRPLSSTHFLTSSNVVTGIPRFPLVSPRVPVVYQSCRGSFVISQTFPA